VNVLNLAKSAGTSVKQIECFNVGNIPLAKNMWKPVVNPQALSRSYSPRR
jgi:hypothetical protein